MHIAFLYNEFSDDPAFGTGPEQPVDFAPAEALRRLGHDVTLVAATLNLAEVRDRLQEAEPELVFNRVESLGGSDRMQAAVTLLLDSLGLPYTGCHTAAMVGVADKLVVKQRLRAAGLPTPDWIAIPSPSGRGDGGEGSSRHPHSTVEDNGARETMHPHPNPLPKGEGTRYILKSTLEHASFQMDDNAVFTATSVDEAIERISEREAEWCRPHFAEQYIDGREFNLSLLCGEVLPPAEIDFSAFPDGRPWIVNQRAKFDAESFEYHNTPRRFDFPPHDRLLVEQMSQLAAACWHLFGLSGFVRVDFRCDRSGRPFILEINSNPCLERASGFAAALEVAGIGYDGGIQRLVEDARTRGEGGGRRGEVSHERSSRSSPVAARPCAPPSALRLPP